MANVSSFIFVEIARNKRKFIDGRRSKEDKKSFVVLLVSGKGSEEAIRIKAILLATRAR